MDENFEMEVGKIYFVSFGINTQIVGRYKGSDACNHYFFDILHYWNGYESFRKQKEYCVRNGIEEIRPATLPEKHTLIRFELEHNCI